MFTLMILFGVWSMQLVGDFFSSGQAYTTHFERSDYNGAVQNWDAAQHPDGRMFFANQSSVLYYNGAQWQASLIDNRRPVRSIAVSETGTVYAGGLNEFGRMSADSLGLPIYESISQHLPESDSNFGNISYILTEDDSAWFATNQQIFEWSSDSLRRIDEEFDIRVIRKVGEKLIIRTADRELFQFQSGTFQKIDNPGTLAQITIRIVLPHPAGLLFLAGDGNGYIHTGSETLELQLESAAYFNQFRPYRGIQLSDETYAIATLGGGVVVFDQNGRHISTYTTQNGLSTDMIYNLFEDNQQGIWLTHDSGISRLEHFYPVRYFDDSHLISGTVLEVLRKDQTVFLATTAGLLTFTTEEQIQPHPEITNWVRHILDIEGGILVAGGDGLQMLGDNGQLSTIHNTASYHIHQSKTDKNVIFVSQQENILVIQWDGAEWNVLFEDVKIPNYYTELVEYRAGELWFSPVGHQAMRLRYEIRDGTFGVQELLQFNADHGMDSDNVIVHRFGNEPVFATREQGLFRFDFEYERFIRETRLHNALHNKYVFQMQEDSQRSLWLRSANTISERRISDNQKKLIPTDDGSYELQLYPFSRMDNSPIQTIYPDDGGLVWFGGAQILKRYDEQVATSFEYKKTAKVDIFRVFIRRDSLLYGGWDGEQFSSPVLPYTDNELRFEFGLPRFDYAEENQFQIRLLPIESGWQNWSYETFRDYTNLREGHYTFEVRARDIYDNISEAGIFSFRVLPPWYRTWWAYTIFASLFFGFIYGLHRYRIIQITKVFETRNRIASDLHDEVSATISSINYFVKALEISLDDKEKRLRLVNMIKEGAAESQDKISDIVWSVSPEHDDWHNLFTHFRHFASELFESCGIEHNIKIPESIESNTLTMEVRRDIWLILKEISNNIVKHSECKHVRIVIQFKGKELHISISDDGKGFDVDKEFNGFGLKNIRTRAERLHADLDIISQHGEGSTFKLILRL